MICKKAMNLRVIVKYSLLLFCCRLRLGSTRNREKEGTNVSARRFIFDSNNKFTGWTSWEQFAACSTQCVSGYEKQTKECCDTGDNKLCYNLPWNHLKSLVGTCPNDGMWSDWSNWSICSVTCSTGSMIRKRNCTYNQPVAMPGFPCQGKASESKVCQMTLCPVNGHWSDWSNFTACTVSCAGGTKVRIRTCLFNESAPHGSQCFGNRTDTQDCNTVRCPVNGHWSDWSKFTDCTVSCAGGTKVRNRTCLFDKTAPHGAQCFGNTTDTRECNTEHCPVNGHWSDWSNFTKCTVSCAGGTKVRNRTCLFDESAPHGAQCFGNITDTRDCNTVRCPATTISTSTTTTPTTTTRATTTPSTTTTIALPTTPRSCFTCQGPPVICEKLNFPADCPLEKQFCINSLSNFKNASRIVDMRCGTRKECQTGWFEKYSTDDKCTSFDQTYLYTSRFDCEFCCNEDNCNQFINPAIKWHP
ncbi:coadhesin-like isoform X2 [Mercenaria mercenaria]|uniref:coadhesin-like isoform X2 n=1 Tax=Mercenaria mercenaria TaxID=6596 RepID=UPI00234E64C5|nr:coadhesin-like isoform X2 [Mercenaria mercenaria]